MPNQEVILNILEVTETMEEGLTYIEERLKILDIESTREVLLDLINGFAAVEEAIRPMMDSLKDNEILEKTETLKRKFNRLVKEYEKENGQDFLTIVQDLVKPAFKSWKGEVDKSLRPYVLS